MHQPGAGDAAAERFVSHAPDRSLDAEVAAALLAEQAPFPFIEGDIAHFLSHEQPDRIVGLSADWNGYDMRESVMTSIGGGLLHYAHRFEPDARLDYMLVTLDTRYRDRSDGRDRIPGEAFQSMLDPLNTRRGQTSFGPCSELAMPAYTRPPVTVPRPGAPAGSLHHATIASGALGGDRSYSVYLPPGHARDRGPYATAYFHDGGDYLTMGAVATTLDNLIADRTLPPLVAVFISPGAREIEYNCDDRHVAFLADELHPELVRRHALATAPARTAVIGPSLGGLISLYAGFRRPDRFGLLGAQSPAVHSMYGRHVFDARQHLVVAGTPPARVALAIGVYERYFGKDLRGQWHDLLTPARQLRDALTEHCIPTAYTERHQGHSWGFWRDTLPDVLTSLFAD